MKIMFMGTPDFAVGSLEAMLKNNMNVIAVVSQPDRPKGRGHILQPTDVKKVAIKANIPVYQPETLKNNQLMPVLEEYNPDVIVVTAYGKILPEYIINYPKYGCINVHASLLPKYRGAAPIQWAIINGEKKTGVTIMKMDKGIDTGDILMMEETEIKPYETAEKLFDRLSVMGGALLVKTLHSIDTITPIPQNHNEHTYAPMISKETGRIDWCKSAQEISNLISGLNSWPLAYTNYKDKTVKIISAEVSDEICCEECGTILALEKNKGLKVATGNGTLYIQTAQFAGSKKMKVEEYVRGHEIVIGTVLN